VHRVSAWIPAFSMLLVSLISYIDRNTLALLAPTILKETGLSAYQYGWIISAFSVCYMIANPIWGRLLDRFGLAKGMTAAVSFWSLASVSHAWASGFWSFAFARAALGFGEGATFPGGLRTVMQTLDARYRSRGIALAYSGGSLGAIATPIIITPIALRWGWRGAFWFTGIIGALWLAQWLLLSRRQDIRAPHSEAAELLDSPSLRDPRLWSFMAAYSLGGIPLAFVLYTTSIYLGQGMGLSQSRIGDLLWIPPLGWELGYFFWGWQADRKGLRRQGSIHRFGGFFLLLALLSLPLAAAARIPSVPLLMTLTFFAMFIGAGFIILSVAYATSMFSADHAAFLAGLGAGSWSALVALVMPWFGRLMDVRGYDAAFATAALLPLSGWALWRWLNRKSANLAAARSIPI